MFFVVHLYICIFACGLKCLNLIGMFVFLYNIRPSCGNKWLVNDSFFDFQLRNEIKVK